MGINGGELYEPRECTQSELNPFRCTFYATQCCQLKFSVSPAENSATEEGYEIQYSFLALPRYILYFRTASTWLVTTCDTGRTSQRRAMLTGSATWLTGRNGVHSIPQVFIHSEWVSEWANFLFIIFMANTIGFTYNNTTTNYIF